MWLCKACSAHTRVSQHLGMGPVSMQNRYFSGCFRVKFYRKISVSFREQKSFICLGRMGKAWVKSEDARHA